jgi:hypothetical protein
MGSRADDNIRNPIPVMTFPFDRPLQNVRTDGKV